MNYAAQTWHDSQPFTERREEWAKPTRPCGFISPRFNVERFGVNRGEVNSAASTTSFIVYEYAIPCMAEVIIPSCEVSSFALPTNKHLSDSKESQAADADTEAIKLCLDKIDALSLWQEKHSEEAPNLETIATAKNWLHGLYYDAQAVQNWSEPTITVSEDAEIVFEWWHDHKSLTIYVQDDNVTFIQSWGTNILNEMKDGNASSVADRRATWSWLMG